MAILSQPDQELAGKHGVQARFFLVTVTTAHLARLADMSDRGDLRTRMGLVLPLAEAREAHLMLEGRHPAPKGKIVLAVDGR